ncbi:MAG: hypothetical protein IIC84_08815 [Chloroflexi bacterium]|nr:hypothetical protein [Chloroflexota bacterium]
MTDEFHFAESTPPSSPTGGDEFKGWVQFVLLLPEDVPVVLPWLEASYNHVSSSE